MSTVSTHVLDSVHGRPAAGVRVRLEKGGEASWAEVATGVTDDDGRIAVLGPDRLDAALYRLVFETGPYFAAAGQPTFYPQVHIVFGVDDPQQHYHVPLLLSPFAYSTYRGS